jgi:parallel beta-helix repeat protein
MEVDASPPISPPPPPPAGGSVNVKDYGALGDGLHDDTQAFNAALAALSASGGTLLVPSGTYVLTPKTGVPDRGLDLSRRSNITIAGAGLDQTVLRLASRSYVGSGDTHLVFLDESSNITFRGLTLDGNRQNATFADEQNHCVEVWSSTDVLFEHVLFHNCRGDGIRLMGIPSAGDPWTQRVTIQDSRFEDNGRSGIAVQRGVSDLKILRNTFQRISDQSIDIEPTGGDSPTDVLIEGNTIRHSTGTWAVGIGGIGGGDVAKRFTFRNNRVENGSVLIYKAHDVTIENNVILGDPYHSAGLRLTHDMASVLISNNQVNSPGQSEGAAIQVVGLNGHYPSSIFIRDNTVSSERGGIHVRDALHGVTVQNNTVLGSGAGSGVMVTNIIILGLVHSNISIFDNVISNFTVGVSLNTQGDDFTNVEITQNDIDHDQSPPTTTIGLLFDKTGPYETFAVVSPNLFGPGIRTRISIRN